jgi:hypothetical protein
LSKLKTLHNEKITGYFDDSASLAACNSGSDSDSKTDSVKNAIDSTADAKIDKIDSARDVQKEKIDSLADRKDSAKSAKEDKRH